MKKVLLVWFVVCAAAMGQLVMSPNAGVAGAQGAVELTYDELVSRISAKALVVGQVYKLTDYRNRYIMPNSDPADTITQDVEPLILTAISKEALSPVAYSPEYPQDVIYYAVDAPNIDGADRGWIYRRIDTKQNVDVPCDWRHILLRRWEPLWENFAVYDSSEEYGKYNVVRNDDGTLIMMSVRDNNGSDFVNDYGQNWLALPFNSDNDYFLPQTYSPLYVLDGMIEIQPDASSYQDFLMFDANSIANIYISGEGNNFLTPLSVINNVWRGLNGVQNIRVHARTFTNNTFIALSLISDLEFTDMSGSSVENNLFYSVSKCHFMGSMQSNVIMQAVNSVFKDAFNSNFIERLDMSEVSLGCFANVIYGTSWGNRIGTFFEYNIFNGLVRSTVGHGVNNKTQYYALDDVEIGTAKSWVDTVYTNYTVTKYDRMIYADASGIAPASITITLPEDNSVPDGTIVTIRAIAGSVTLSRVDAQSPYGIVTSDYYTIIKLGGTWWIVKQICPSC